nr:CBN-CRB-1 protein [Haemonchus contortus]
MPKSTLVDSTFAETVTLRPAESATTGTPSKKDLVTVATISLYPTHSVKVSKMGKPEQIMTNSADATLRVTNYETTSQSLPVYTSRSVTTSTDTTLLPTTSSTTEHQPSTIYEGSKFSSPKAAKNNAAIEKPDPFGLSAKRSLTFLRADNAATITMSTETVQELSLAHNVTRTDAETLISSTITTPRLHSDSGVSEKKLTNATKANVVSTSETAMPARIVEPTPRYHGHKHCNRNVFMLLNLNDILHGSGPNQTVHVGGTIQVGCPSSGGDGNITLTCEKTGSFVPSPSTLSCTSGVKTPFNTKELKSCEQCDAFGTETCEKKKSGIACQCRENWSGQTCWKAADQCDITHLQCGKHGVCRSEVDYASCVCDYGFAGEHCNISKTNTTIISSHKVVR